MRVPLVALVSSLPELPPPEALEAARDADRRAGWSEAEAAWARRAGLVGIAAAHDERARGYRREALRVLGAGG